VNRQAIDETQMSSDNGTASYEDISEEVIEDLKNKGLYPFVVRELSSNTAITISIFENEKYRPIVREWGSAIGIHLIPPFDRKPFTDDFGKRSIRWVKSWHIVG
jgi:hypothetical protein